MLGAFPVYCLLYVEFVRNSGKVEMTSLVQTLSERKRVPFGIALPTMWPPIKVVVQYQMKR